MQGVRCGDQLFAEEGDSVLIAATFAMHVPSAF